MTFHSNSWTHKELKHGNFHIENDGKTVPFPFIEKLENKKEKYQTTCDNVKLPSTSLVNSFNKSVQKSTRLHSITYLLARNESIIENNSQCSSMSPVEKVRIWRPFSPSPKHQSYTVSCQLCGYEHDELNRSKIIFPPMKPSAVKLEASESSVFQPVKKRHRCSVMHQKNGHSADRRKKHTVVKTFRCDQLGCCRVFSRNEELTRHRRIHSGYKPHHCQVCEKKFARKDHLNKHLKTHLQASEKKVYLCLVPGCGHRYTRSDALTRHKTTAHSTLISTPVLGNK